MTKRTRVQQMAKDVVGKSTISLASELVGGLPSLEERGGDCGPIAWSLLTRTSYDEAREVCAANGWTREGGMKVRTLVNMLKAEHGRHAGNFTRQFKSTTLRSYLHYRAASGWTGLMVVRTTGRGVLHFVPVLQGVAVNLDARDWDAELLFTLKMK